MGIVDREVMRAEEQSKWESWEHEMRERESWRREREADEMRANESWREWEEREIREHESWLRERERRTKNEKAREWRIFIGNLKYYVKIGVVELFRRGVAPLDSDKSKSAVFEAGRPPRIAQFALLMIPRRNREHLLGDLEEEYRAIVLPEYGQFWARVWYWVQAIQALGFYSWPFLKRVLGMAGIWKVIGR